MEIAHVQAQSESSVSLRLSEEFLAPYRQKGDPFQNLLARSTYLNKYCRGNESWTDTICRVIEGNVAFDPGVTQQEAELLFHLFWTGQALPPGRGLWTGGVEGIPADARYNCFSAETRFWANGVLTSFEEAVGLTVEVLSRDGTWRPAQVRSFGRQKLYRYLLKPPFNTNFGFNFTATENHRWFTSNRGEVTDLKVGDKVLITPRTPDKTSSEYTEGFAHGFVFGDGSRETLKPGVFKLRLCGEKDWVHADALKQSRRYHNVCSPPSCKGDPILFFRSSENLKALPGDDASSDYQAGFLAGWMAADGSLRSDGSGGNRLAAQNEAALDWVVDRAPLLGYCVSGRSTDPTTETNYGVRKAPCEVLTLHAKPMEYFVRAVIDEGREEETYCVVEPETHSFTLAGGVVTGNCWWTTLRSPEDWTWAMNQLMLGGGVGVGIHEIERLPTVALGHARLAIWCGHLHPNFDEVKPNDKSFLNGSTPVFKAEDSRGGWVEALRRVLKAAYEGTDLIVDVGAVRPRGQRIKTFGGIACGPGPLAHLLRSVWAIVRTAEGRRLSSVEALDVTNLIGFCVKSGNVRRSALIVLGEAEDQEFRNAKKDTAAVYSHRHTSNNSIRFRSWDQINNFNWKGLVDDNIEFGEPGIVNMPLIWEKDPGATGMNPCFAGDTLVAVADGRNAVPIKQLAEEGRDVPVYSMDKKTGKVEIKMGRHPRVTGHQQRLVRVWLDDGGHLDTTPDHKFVLMDGSTVKAKELLPGTSLPRFTKALERVKANSKDYYRIYCDTRDPSKDKLFEHRLVARFFGSEEWDRVYRACVANGFVSTGGLVVHHRDYNQLNNASENLQIMTFEDHAELHASQDQAGEKNGRWSGITNEGLKQHGLLLTQALGRRFSLGDWGQYAQEHSLPQQFSAYRRQCFGSILGLAKLCAAELGLEHLDEDPRVVATYRSMLEQGYEARVSDGAVLVSKTCEGCGASFEVPHAYRERSFCSMSCGNAYINTDPQVKAHRVQGVRKTCQIRMHNVRAKQASVCSSLTFSLGRKPNRREWSLACKEEGVPSRIGPTLEFGFREFSEVLKAGEVYNHKVVKVEDLPGEHTVYNITVDDFHTVALVSSTRVKRGNNCYTGVYVGQCGEVNLHDKESCNLAEVFPAKFDGSVATDLIFKLVTRYSLRQRMSPLEDPEADAVQRANMRVGVGLGGICDFDYTREMLTGWYKLVRSEADSYAQALGVSRPIAVTTVKPSGTISLITGSSPGIHAPYAPHYIRRTRVADNDPMTEALKDAGVPWEYDKYDQTGHTLVFEFPMKALHTRFTVQTESARDQFERQAQIQDWWSDNAVSATLSFDPETEREEMATLLESYVPRFKSTSMLAKNHSYEQAPYEAITVEEYAARVSGINHQHPLTRGGDFEIDECTSGACPIR